MRLLATASFVARHPGAIKESAKDLYQKMAAQDVQRDLSSGLFPRRR
jgi:hypothetical protein